jgi:peptidoglycan hydrolase-like protein with peptidoglycan-binding domain
MGRRKQATARTPIQREKSDRTLTPVQRSVFDDLAETGGQLWARAAGVASAAAETVAGAAGAAYEAVSDLASSAYQAGSQAWTGLTGGAGPASPPERDGGKSAGPGGEDVYRIQRLLATFDPSVPQHGSLDPATVGVIRRFQAATGLTADGIPGPNTLGRLIRFSAIMDSLASGTYTVSTALKRRIAAALEDHLTGMSEDELLAFGLTPTHLAGLGVPLPIPHGRIGCSPVQCPEEPIEIPAVYPIYAQAEQCIRQQYREAHEGNTISGNREFATLNGKDPREREALECFKRHFTAASAMYLGEPDIWDITQGTMYEVTTDNGAAFRKGKLRAEIQLANAISASPGCGGMTFEAGTWTPDVPCLYIGEGVSIQVRNEDGVLIYKAAREGKKKQQAPDPVVAALLALAAIGILLMLLSPGPVKLVGAGATAIAIFLLVHDEPSA